MSIHQAQGKPIGSEGIQSDEVFDFANPLVSRTIRDLCRSDDLGDNLASWYCFVRDSIRYDPYAIELEARALSASRTLNRGSGHCIHKSVLFVAGLRALGVPARLGLARVRNHLATEKLERRLGTDVLVPHGYAAHWNGKRWVKSTPVFNRELCERLGTQPLAWSAEEDRLFQPTDANGSQFMEYLEDYGLFAEVPLDFLKVRLQAEYPHCFTASGQWSLPPEG
ncbi:MAG: transglutaminase-like domain-containing protein [Flavobacteriales bacterium]